MLHGLPSYIAQFHSPSVAMRAVFATLRRPCDALEVGMGSLVDAKIPKEHLQVEGFVLTCQNTEKSRGRRLRSLHLSSGVWCGIILTRKGHRAWRRGDDAKVSSRP